MKNTLISAIDYNVCLNRNGYTDSKGCRQVVVELYQRGCRRIVNTHIHVRATDFHFGRIQTTHPDHDLLNRKIRRIVRRLMELEDEMLDAGQTPTPQRLVEALRLNLTRSTTIQEWVDSIIMPSARRTVTKGNYRTLCRSLELFHPDLHIGEVSHDLIERWQNWMRRERKLGDNRNANSSLREVGKLAKLHRRLHWHLARHTCGTLLNQRGLRMQEIQYILGHQKMQTTERHYAETTFEQVRKSLKKAFKQS